MKKNVAGQTVGAQMVSATDGSAFTSAVTVYVTGDAGTQAAGSVGAGACTHEGNGFHTYAPAQAETNYDHVAFTFVGTGAVSQSVQVWPNFPQTGDSYARIGANGAGLTSVADTSGTTTLLTRLSVARAGYLDNLSVGAVALEASVQSVLSKLLKYVQLIVRKDSAIATDNATEVTAINANGGSGAGAFANTTDSQEALRDRGDSAWTTATGFSTHTAADVWAVGTRTLTSFGTLVADVWAYATRVLTGYGTLAAPLDAAATRSAVGLASANLDTQLDAIPTANENADALLKRDWTAVTGEAARSALNALRFLRNKWAISAGTLTVNKEDDTTSAWTGAVTTTAGDPASSIDPS